MPLSYLKLTRPANAVLIMLAVHVGAATDRAHIGDPLVWLAAVASALVATGGYVWNDINDVGRDRTNKPNRLLASGRTGTGGASILAASLTLLGLVLAWTIGTIPGILASAWVGLLVLYERGLKGRHIWGNVVVSAVASTAFLMGGVVEGNALAALVPTGFAFLCHLGREIWKDAADVAGDRETGLHTLAVREGVRAALRGGSLVLGVLVLLSPIPFFIGLYNGVYLFAVLIGVDVPLMVMIYRVWNSNSSRRAARAQEMSKLAMAAGLLALSIAAL